MWVSPGQAKLPAVPGKSTSQTTKLAASSICTTPIVAIAFGFSNIFPPIAVI